MPSDDRVEHFLVDGVAPPVIGGGPPESPFDLEPDPEPRHAQAAPARPGQAPLAAPGHAPPAHSGPSYGQPPPPGPTAGGPGSGPPYGNTAPAPPFRQADPGGPAYGHVDPAQYQPADREPPTSPIPAIDPLPPEPEKRKSWVSKVFRLPGS